MEAHHRMRWKAELVIKTSIATVNAGTYTVSAYSASEAKRIMKKRALKKLRIPSGEVEFFDLRWSDPFSFVSENTETPHREGKGA